MFSESRLAQINLNVFYYFGSESVLNLTRYYRLKLSYFSTYSAGNSCQLLVNLHKIGKITLVNLL